MWKKYTRSVFNVNFTLSSSVSRDSTECPAGQVPPDAPLDSPPADPLANACGVNGRSRITSDASSVHASRALSVTSPTLDPRDLPIRKLRAGLSLDTSLMPQHKQSFVSQMSAVSVCGQ